MHGIEEYSPRNNRSTPYCDEEPLNDHRWQCKLYTTNYTAHIHLRSNEKLCSSRDERWTSMPFAIASVSFVTSVHFGLCVDRNERTSYLVRTYAMLSLYLLFHYDFQTSNFFNFISSLCISSILHPFIPLTVVTNRVHAYLIGRQVGCTSITVCRFPLVGESLGFVWLID